MFFLSSVSDNNKTELEQATGSRHAVAILLSPQSGSLN